MEGLLNSIVDNEAAIAIIDITGVPTVDTLVAQHLLKTVAAARLMGAECIISGIRPQIAQTIVHLGVDLGDVVTKATLAEALKIALRRVGSHSHQAKRGQSGRLTMEQIPVLKLGEFLLVSIQVELHDEFVLSLQEDLTSRIESSTGPAACLSISRRWRSSIRSLVARSGHIAAMARVLDAETVLVGMRPAVAITLVELGMSLKGIRTALDVDKGMAMLAVLGRARENLHRHAESGRPGDSARRPRSTCARKAVQDWATRLAFGTLDRTKFVTAASELARNTLVHGKGGTLHACRSREGRASGDSTDFRGQGSGHSEHRAGTGRWVTARRRAWGWDWVARGGSSTNSKSLLRLAVEHA